MVASCSAMNCTNRAKKDVKLKFHKIPKDSNLRQLWLHALRRAKYNPGGSAVICEKHFTDEDYELNVYGNRVLKKGTIPSVFDFPSHLKRDIKKQRVLKRIIETSVAVTEEHANQLIDTGVSNDSHSDSTTIKWEDGEKPQEPQKYSDNENENNLSGPSTCKKRKLDPSTSNETLRVKNTKRNRREPYCFGDFKESDMTHDETRKRFFKVANETVCRYKKLNKYYQCKIRRQNKKINSLNDLLNELINA